MSNHNTGLEAEARALAFLRGEGFALIAQRYRNAYGEIDLVLSKQSALHFVEVKARKSLDDGLYALSAKQQQRIWNCALGFLAEHPQYETYTAQIDLIAIAGSQLHHEANIMVGE